VSDANKLSLIKWRQYSLNNYTNTYQTYNIVHCVACSSIYVFW